METMRLVKLTTLIALCLVLSLPAFAGFTTFATPGGYYQANTIDYGGGAGSGGAITSLPPFDFSLALGQRNVPGSWATWNCPPATYSCTPNVLYTQGATSLTLTLTSAANIVGFELEPDAFAQEQVTAEYFNGVTP